MAMDIRPAPLHRVADGSGPRGRLALIAPVAVLVVVAGAAWAGASLGALGGQAAQPGAGTIPEAAAKGGTGAQVSAAPRGHAADFGFPGLALGLPIWTGAELQDGRASGAVGGELVAVAGVLRSDALPLSCPAIRLTLARTFCHRLASLFPVSEPGPETDPSAPRAVATLPPGPIIPAHFLPGTDLPASLGLTTDDLLPWKLHPVPVVLAGRYEDPRAPPCGSGQEWCRTDFVVEHVVWADGLWLGPPIVRDLGVPETPDARDPADPAPVAANSIPGSGRGRIVLSQALLRPELLGVVDPIAARAAAEMHGSVWYVRSIATVVAGEKPQVGWAVIDDATGTVLAHSWAPA
jgi:hypothetical protein